MREETLIEFSEIENEASTCLAFIPKSELCVNGGVRKALDALNRRLRQFIVRDLSRRRLLVQSLSSTVQSPSTLFTEAAIETKYKLKSGTRFTIKVRVLDPSHKLSPLDLRTVFQAGIPNEDRDGGRLILVSVIDDHSDAFIRYLNRVPIDKFAASSPDICPLYSFGRVHELIKRRFLLFVRKSQATDTSNSAASAYRRPAA